MLDFNVLCVMFNYYYSLLNKLTPENFERLSLELIHHVDVKSPTVLKGTIILVRLSVCMSMCMGGGCFTPRSYNVSFLCRYLTRPSMSQTIVLCMLNYAVDYTHTILNQMLIRISRTR